MGLEQKPTKNEQTYQKRITSKSRIDRNKKLFSTLNKSRATEEKNIEESRTVLAKKLYRKLFTLKKKINGHNLDKALKIITKLF